MSRVSRKGFTLDETFLYNGKPATLRQLDDEGFLFLTKQFSVEGKGLLQKRVVTYLVWDEPKKRCWAVSEETYDALKTEIQIVKTDDGFDIVPAEESAA